MDSRWKTYESSPFCINDPVLHMGQLPQDGENGQHVAFLIVFGALLRPNNLIFFNFSQEEASSSRPGDRAV